MSLRDDPELGPLFQELDAVLDHRPLDPLRPPTSAAEPSWATWGPVAGGGVVVVALIAWMAWPVAPPAVAPSPEAPVAIAAPSSAPGPTVPADPSPPEAPAAPAAPSLPARPAPTAPVVPVVAAEVPPPNVPPTPIVPAPAPTNPLPNTLEAERILFEPAEAAVNTGQWDVALSAAEAYLRAYPEGRWVDKVWLLQLDALAGAGRWPEVARLAGELSERPQLSMRRDDLLRIRGEALAATGDCAGALAIADRLPRGEGAAIRRACR